MSIESQAPYLTVVIPCYNEARNLERGVLDEVHDYLVRQTYVWEVIIVNDESTDTSKQLIEAFIRQRPRFSLVDIPHGGKPATVWPGTRQPGAPWCSSPIWTSQRPSKSLTSCCPGMTSAIRW